MPERKTKPPRLDRLREQAAGCQACPLWRNATQTVFGEGGTHAWLMLVGEQPGDQEDREGHPFVGPAGRVLREALSRAGVTDDEVYVTNAVKHFKWRPSGKRRLHDRPNQSELAACRMWLELEIQAVAPRVVLALGASAARSLVGRMVRVNAERGRPLSSTHDAAVGVTLHPSAILRMRDSESRHTAMTQLVEDLRTVRRWAARS